MKSNDRILSHIYIIFVNVMIYIGPCTNGEIRLEGANYDNEGRVQICFNNVWGTVCDSTWGLDEASVVCRQLGFPADGQCSL